MEKNTDGQNSAKKRKNEATSERLKKRKAQQAAVVVQGINTVLKGYPYFVEKIQKTVKTVSELAVITSWALNHHLLYCFQHEKNIPDINQSFCYTAMALCCGSTVAGQKTPDLCNSIQLFRNLFPANFNWPTTKGVGVALHYLAKQMATEFSNYLIYGLEKHVGSVLQAQMRVEENVQVSKMHVAQRWNLHIGPNSNKKSLVLSSNKEEEQALDNMIEHLRQLKSPIKQMNYLLQKALQLECKSFTLFPIHSFRHCFITLDKTSFRTDWKLTDNDWLQICQNSVGTQKEVGTFSTDGIRWHTSVFKEKSSTITSMLELKKEKRQNDGQYLSRHCLSDTHKIKRGMYDLSQLTPESLEALKSYNTFEAFDPGKTALYTGDKNTKMTLKQWRVETGIQQYNQKLKKRTEAKNINPVLKKLSDNSLKTACFDTFQERLKAAWIPEWTRLWEYYGHKWFGRQRFWLHIKKQKAYDAVAKSILGPKQDKIAVFGTAFWKSGKGLPPSPVSAVRDYLSKKGTVIMVHEHLTSQRCSFCKTQNHRMRRHPTKHGLFHCTNGCNRTWNRDVNAALNLAAIYRSYLNGNQRPEYLKAEKNGNRTVSKKRKKDFSQNQNSKKKFCVEPLETR